MGGKGTHQSWQLRGQEEIRGPGIHRSTNTTRNSAEFGTSFRRSSNSVKSRGVAMRIGTNHGSLSDRIMNRYGDTPLGMVESALEFARIARDLDYHDFIFSMKASNPKVMIEAYRLLVARLASEGADWNYPIHLGVTEAGDGEDGRIKSAIGIGSLLSDGIGDTVRVSLTEDSIHEIPVARALVEAASGKSDGSHPILSIARQPLLIRPVLVSAPSLPHNGGSGSETRRRGTGSRRRSPVDVRQNCTQGGSSRRLSTRDHLRECRDS